VVVADEKRRGRPTVDKAKRAREDRRKVLHRGMLACYEIIDACRKELAGLDAVDAARKGQA
jgi:hypothetical protein